MRVRVCTSAVRHRKALKAYSQRHDLPVIAVAQSSQYGGKKKGGATARQLNTDKDQFTCILKICWAVQLQIKSQLACTALSPCPRLRWQVAGRLALSAYPVYLALQLSVVSLPTAGQLTSTDEG